LDEFRCSPFDKSNGNLVLPSSKHQPSNLECPHDDSSEQSNGGNALDQQMTAETLGR